MSHRVKYVNPRPLTDVIGSVTFGATSFTLKRGLLATLDGVRAETPAAIVAGCAGVLEIEAERARLIPGDTAEFVVLAAAQVAWYEETQGRVPVSCAKTLEKAKAAAR